VLLKLALKDGRPPISRWQMNFTSTLRGYTPSNAPSLAFHTEAGLEDRLNRSALLDSFCMASVMPSGEKGAMTRGVPTGYAAPPLLKSIAASSEPPPVWPYADGPVRGTARSLHKNVPQAALEDSKFMNCWRWSMHCAMEEHGARAGRSRTQERLEGSSFDLSDLELLEIAAERSARSCLRLSSSAAARRLCWSPIPEPPQSANL